MLYRTCLALAVFGLLTPLAHAADPITIRFAVPPTGPTFSLSYSEFVTGVNKNITGLGKLEIRSEVADTLGALHSGEAELAVIPTGQLANSKARGLALFNIPFVFNDLNETARMQRGALGDAMLSSVAVEGLVGLGYWNLGMQRIYGPPIRTVEALKGLKIRATSRDTQETLAAMGASPISLSFADAYAALERGGIDAIGAAPTSVLNNKYYEAKKSLMDTGFVPQVFVVAASEVAWKTFPFQVQATIADWVGSNGVKLTADVNQLEARAVSSLKEQGVQVAALSTENVQKLRSSAEVAWASRNVGGEKLVFVALQAANQDQRQPLPRDINPDEGARPTGVKSLFFATDRKMEKRLHPNFQFGSARGELSYGTVRVNLGKERLTAGPGAETQIEDIGRFAGKAEFVRRLARSLDAAKSREVFIYIHGYNKSFRDAAESGALLITDLKFKGVPIIFSWPSDGAAVRYSSDEDEAETSRNSLVAVLAALKEVPKVGKIHVLVHSMGSRVVGNALEWMAGQSGGKQFLQNVIFAAPDVYVARFSQVIGSLPKSAKRVTLYASAADQALYCSQLIHEGARAGQGGQNRVVHSSMETIDVSNAEAVSFAAKIAPYSPIIGIANWLMFESCRTGHSYITRNLSVLNDLHSLVTFDAAPDDRILLQRQQAKGGPYWEMKRGSR